MIFNIVRRERLRKRYHLAVKNGEETFEFDGHTFLTSYAKYLLEYLQNLG